MLLVNLFYCVSILAGIVSRSNALSLEDERNFIEHCKIGDDFLEIFSYDNRGYWSVIPIPYQYKDRVGFFIREKSTNVTMTTMSIPTAQRLLQRLSQELGSNSSSHGWDWSNAQDILWFRGGGSSRSEVPPGWKTVVQQLAGICEHNDDTFGVWTRSFKTQSFDRNGDLYKATLCFDPEEGTRDC